jgi:orotidine-5'-phosphate decarboxylase
LIFAEKLKAATERNDSLLCVGLDPVVEKLPDSVQSKDNPTLYFCQKIIDATADLACAYKPNLGFFGALGESGWGTLRSVLAHVPAGIPTIIDAKVGDIQSTAVHYAAMFFDHLGGDAVTVNPYMGSDAVRPFLERPDKAAFVLCLTSNNSCDEFETLDTDDGAVYELVARKAVEWSGTGNCGLVVGATKSATIGRIRSLAPQLPLLVPGVGAQGGDLAAAVSSGIDAEGAGILINASRSILYAGSGADFDTEARRVSTDLRNEINKYRNPVAA